MTVNEYIDQLKGTIAKIAQENDFEVCSEAQELVRILEAKDTAAYIKFCFDIKTMTKVGFFKKGMTAFDMAERVCVFFGFDNVFQYSIKEGLWCPYERYAQGIHDMIRKVKW